MSGSITVDKKTLATSTPPPAGTYTGPTVPSLTGEEPPSIAVYGPETLRVSKKKRVVRLVVFSSGTGKLDGRLGSLSLGTRVLRTGNNDLRFTIPRSVTRVAGGNDPADLHERLDERHSRRDRHAQARPDEVTSRARARTTASSSPCPTRRLRQVFGWPSRTSSTPPGLTTTYGSAVFADHVPTRRPRRSLRLERAGYANVGKTNLHEFAYGITSQNPHFGTVPNPLAPGPARGRVERRVRRPRSRPGSPTRRSAPTPAARSGSRRPAAASSASSRRYGLVPIDGCFPLAPSFDHAGPMARDVAECERMMAALAPGFEPRRARVARGAAGRRRLAGRRRPARARAGRGGRRALPAARARVDAPAARTASTPLFMREVADVHRELFAEHARRSTARTSRPKIERCLARRRDAEVAAARGARASATASSCARRARGRRPARSRRRSRFVAPPAGVDELAMRERARSASRPLQRRSAGRRSRFRADRPRTACPPRSSSSARRATTRSSSARLASASLVRGTADRSGLPTTRGTMRVAHASCWLSSLALVLGRRRHAAPSAASTAPQGLHAFLFRADEPARAHVRAHARRSRGLRFPAPSTTSSSSRRATRSARTRSSTARRRLTSPVAAPPLTPAVDHRHAVLALRAGARGDQGRRRRRGAKPFGFDMRRAERADAAPSDPGLLRWTPVDGATRYQVWLIDADEDGVRRSTNVLDEREFYTFHQSRTVDGERCAGASAPSRRHAGGRAAATACP